MGTDRVVVTGMGLLTPVGNTLEEFADAIFEGRNSIGPITSFDVSQHNIKQGGEVKNFHPENYFNLLDYRQFDRSTQFAVATSKMALQMSGVEDGVYDSRRLGCIFGTTMGNQQISEKYTNLLVGKNKESIQCPFQNFQPNAMTSAIAAELKLKGPNLVIPTACAAGNYAIGYGADLIKSGKADCIICGGSDAMSRVCYTMFSRLGAMSSDLCQPFDENRQGMIVSEGAAALVLESYESAKKRSATIYAEILGYGNSCDAYHATAPHPEGQGARLAIHKAFNSSGTKKSDIGYISAHGTGTKANDAAESYALTQTFGDAIKSIPVSSIKSMFGHAMGAAAAIEAVASVLVLNEGRLPVNMNLEHLDPKIGLNVVSKPTAAKDIDCILSNSFAFGGNISCIILSQEK